MEEKSKISVYYNSACPVCDAGIRSQKDKTTACLVEWKDIHLDNTLVEEIDEELEYVRERLHVVDENGRKRMGIEAFEVLWRNSPKEKWKAKLISLPIIKQSAQLGYMLFARLLYRWNKRKKHW